MGRWVVSMTGGEKILVVDDCSMLRETVTGVLRNVGYEVTEAENGKTAIQKFLSDSYHLVITDLNMPVLGGLGLIRMIRLAPLRQNVPVLVLSSEAAEDHRLNREISGWIQKPFSPALLLSVIARLLGARRKGGT